MAAQDATFKHAQCYTNHIQNWAKADLKTVNRVMWCSLGFCRWKNWRLKGTGQLERNNPSLNLPLYCQCDGSINYGCLTFIISNCGEDTFPVHDLSSDGTYAVGVVCSICFCWPNTKILEFWLEAASMMYNWMFWTIPRLQVHSIALVNVHLWQC